MHAVLTNLCGVRGAHIAVAVMIKILETQLAVPHPLALQLNYAALDFNFTSWMSPTYLRVLRSEQSVGHLPGLADQKDHFKHISPLSMVGDRKAIRRQRSWKDALRHLTSSGSGSERPSLRTRASAPNHKVVKASSLKPMSHSAHEALDAVDETGSLADEEDGADLPAIPDEDKPIHARVRFHPVVNQLGFEKVIAETPPADRQGNALEQAPLGTRLTMTSRTGYFQDRIISPSMVSRAQLCLRWR
jgi:hypothetical protein